MAKTRKKMPQDAVLFKSESVCAGGTIIGPVWVRRKGKISNYKDSDLLISGTKKFYPEWFTLGEARRLAKVLDLEFEDA